MMLWTRLTATPPSTRASARSGSSSAATSASCDMPFSFANTSASPRQSFRCSSLYPGQPSTSSVSTFRMPCKSSSKSSLSHRNQSTCSRGSRLYRAFVKPCIRSSRDRVSGESSSVPSLRVLGSCSSNALAFARHSANRSTMLIKLSSASSISSWEPRPCNCSKPPSEGPP